MHFNSKKKSNMQETGDYFQNLFEENDRKIRYEKEHALASHLQTYRIVTKLPSLPLDVVGAVLACLDSECDKKRMCVLLGCDDLEEAKKRAEIIRLQELQQLTKELRSVMGIVNNVVRALEPRNQYDYPEPDEDRDIKVCPVTLFSSFVRNWKDSNEEIKHLPSRLQEIHQHLVACGVRCEYRETTELKNRGRRRLINVYLRNSKTHLMLTEDHLEEQWTEDEHMSASDECDGYDYRYERSIVVSKGRGFKIFMHDYDSDHYPGFGIRKSSVNEEEDRYLLEAILMAQPESEPWLELEYSEIYRYDTVQYASLGLRV